MTDGVYLRPVDLDDLGFPDVEIPFLRNDVQFAEFFNLCIECINALRLCGSVNIPTPQGRQYPAGTYPRPLTRTEVNFPEDPVPYFENHTQQARIRNFFVDALNALRRCYLTADPTQQGLSIDGGTYLPPQSILELDFPDSPIPENYFGNHVMGAGLYNYLVDALNRVRACCTSGGGDGSDCAVIAAGTDTIGELDLIDAIKGDNFSDWTAVPDQYADFLVDTETNPNYSNGITPSQVNNPAPGTFWENNFDWDTNDFVVNRNRIGQLNVEGGHRTVKAIKYIEDGERYQFGYEMELNGKSAGYVFESLWGVLRFKFSENFAVYDTDDPNGRGILLFDCLETTADLTAPAKLYGAGVFNYGYYPMADPYGFGGTALVEDILMVQMKWSKSGVGSGVHRANLGTMRELVFTGVERELVVYAGYTYDGGGVIIPGEYRMAVWLNDVGAARTKLYDHTLTGLPHPFRTGSIKAFRATDAWPLKVAQGDIMCYECGGWALYNGNGNEVDGMFDPLGIDV